MTLRSQQQLSKTPEGHEAWRSQALPVIQRQILSRLREPLTVQALLERLSAFDLSQISDAIAALAAQGWVLVEDPAQPEEPDPDETVEPVVDALAELLARRPVAIADSNTDAPLEEDPILDTVIPEAASEDPVPSRGTPAQERALLVAMGLLGDSTSAWPVASVAEASAEAEAEAPHVSEAATSVDEPPPAAIEEPFAPGPESPSVTGPQSLDPRRQEVLRRIQMTTSVKRESREALRSFRAKEQAEREAADAVSQRLREQEAAERELLRRK